MSASEAQDFLDQARGRRLRRIRQLDLGGLLLALVTLLATIVWAFPLIYATFGAFAPRDASAGSGSLLLDIAATIGLYAHVLFGTEIGLWYVNSLVTSSAVTAGVLFISATCGYAISQLDFRGRKLLWVMILMSFMVPIQALIINHFFLMNQLHLINTWLGVILPQLIAPVAVIVYKQFFDSVPRELREAAMIDGATHRQLLFGVFNTGEGVTVPSSRSSVTVSAKGPDGVMTWRAEVALDAGNDAVFASESAVELGSLTTMIGGTLHCRGRLVHTAAARARIRDLEALAGDSGRNDAVALAVR